MAVFLEAMFSLSLEVYCEPKDLSPDLPSHPTFILYFPSLQYAMRKKKHNSVSTSASHDIILLPLIISFVQDA